MRRGFGGRWPRDEDIEVFRKATELDRTLATFERDAIVATAAAVSFGISVPGGATLPCAGVTEVTVQPTHRRRGLLTMMMKRQLADIHERGEPLAALYASEAPIYGRFGYGLATYEVDLEVQRSRSAFRPAADTGGRILLVDRERAARDFTIVLDQVRSQRPGVLRLPDYWMPMALSDFEPWRHGGSEQYLAVYEDGHGTPAGFAWYRTNLEWTDNQPDGTLMMEQLVAATPQAYAALWHYCLQVDLMARVKAKMRPIDEPLRFLLVDARAPKAQVSDSLWVRLVDVPGALRQRRYHQSGALTIEVRDSLCPWNAGRLTLEASGQAASCEATSRSADVMLDVADLAALYLGGNSAQALHAAGRIEERTANSVGLLHRMFQGDVAPWCPTHF